MNATNQPTPELLNETQAAEMLTVKVATLRRWRWAGKEPKFLKLGGAVRYDAAVLVAFIEASRRSNTSKRVTADVEG